MLAILASVKVVVAQQDPMYTQYMDNLLVINPAYAGSREIGNALLVARTQWVEFDDAAPATRSFAYNSTFEKKNVGFGVSVMSDKIGPLKQTGFYVDYAYILQVASNYKLSMGLKGGVSFYRANLTDLQTIDPDPLFDTDIYENFLPNVGVGLFLHSADTYFGISIPRLIENHITREDVTTEYINRQKLHFYAVAGHKMSLDQDFQMKVNGMVKWVSGAPLSFDVSALVGFRERFWLGGMYRLDAAYGVIAQFKPTPKMTIGYSYDFITSELSTFNKGSHEIMLSYDFDLFNRSKPKNLAQR